MKNLINKCQCNSCHESIPRLQVDIKGYYIRCWNCGCFAGYGKSKEDAINNWNKSFNEKHNQ